ncbi:MAG TPA: DUF3301 domain-containing protein, partial [Rhodocyclaceae bacterium]|nr:DUF3301 domain-containing protein [Rhodocyclaceae bacterium]
DETVGLRGLRLRQVNGLRRIERCYGFEVSIDGHDREAARLWMLGSSLSELSLPTVGLASREAIAQPALNAPISNVVQLHTRRNRDADRLH